MTSAFGGQRSIQLSYGCLGRFSGATLWRSAKAEAQNQFRRNPSAPDASVLADLLRPGNAMHRSPEGKGAKSGVRPRSASTRALNSLRERPSL